MTETRSNLVASLRRIASVIVVMTTFAVVAYVAGLLLNTAHVRDENLALWILILSAGVLGGLVFSMRENRLVVPHRDPQDDNVWNPGIVGDCLAGIAGSIVIFMVMPFEPPQQGEIGRFEWMKIIGLAIVGGYGGRLLVEKVLAERIHDIESKMQKAESKERHGARALELVERQLTFDPDPPEEVKKDELIEAMAGSSEIVHNVVLERARGFRRDAIENGMARLSRVYPVFEALIATSDEAKRHVYHAEIAYALKGRAETLPPAEKPEERKALFRKAESSLDEAIRWRDEQKISGFKVYEFVRAIIRIHLDGNTNAAGIHADLEAAFDGGGKPKTWIETPDPELDKPLLDWLVGRRDDAVIGPWIANHVTLPTTPEASPPPAPPDEPLDSD